MNTIEKPFSSILRAARARLNLSQTECARLIPPLSVRVLQNWERGRNTPPEWAQPLIIYALEVERPNPDGHFAKPGRKNMQKIFDQ